MRLDNLPSNATVTVSVGKNKTVIELDFGMHPKDVGMVQNLLLRMCQSSQGKKCGFNTTEQFNKRMNEEIESIGLRLFIGEKEIEPPSIKDELDNEIDEEEPDDNECEECGYKYGNHKYTCPNGNQCGDFLQTYY